MRLKETLDEIRSQIADPSAGLPEDVFRFASSIVPMVNVDLLIRNEQGHTLLTWRVDEFYPPSWHIPGGIIRYKESASARIQAVARNELGVRVTFGSKPCAVNEIMVPFSVRGHFISLLYECRLAGPLPEALRYDGGERHHGVWAWHASCPEDLIPAQSVYRDWLDTKAVRRSGIEPGGVTST